MNMLTMNTKQVRTSLALTSRNSELCDFMFEVKHILSSFEALVKKLKIKKKPENSVHISSSWEMPS